MTILLTNHSFVCLFTLSIFFVSTYYVPDAVTGAECTVKEMPSLHPPGPALQAGDIHQADMQCHWMLVVMSLEKEEIEQDKG